MLACNCTWRCRRNAPYEPSADAYAGHILLAVAAALATAVAATLATAIASTLATAARLRVRFGQRQAP